MNSGAVKYILLLLLLIVRYMLPTDGTLDKFDACFCLIIVFAGVAMTFWDQQHSLFKDNWTKPSNLVILGYLFVSFQYLIDYAFGLKRNTDFIGPEYLYYTCMMVSFGMVAFLIGLSFGHICKPHKQKTKERRRVSLLWLVVLQISMFCGWIATVDILKLIAGDLYLLQDVVTSTSIDGIFEDMFNNSNIAIMACIIYNNYGKKVESIKAFLKENYMISWVFIGIYCLIRIVSGDRGPCLYTILLCLYTYLIVSQYRLKLRYVLSFMLLASFVISIIGAARSLDTTSTFSERVSESVFNMKSSETARFSEKTILPSTEELALSMRCNEYAVAEIHEGGPYHYGSYQLQELLSCIPFLPSYMVNTLKISITNQSSDYLLTYKHEGRVDLYQLGTTNFADFYLDFGLLGMIIAMLLVGAFYGKIDYMVSFNSFKNVPWLFLGLIYSMLSIYMGRGAFLVQIKPILVLLVLFYTNKMLFSKK